MCIGGGSKPAPQQAPPPPPPPPADIPASPAFNESQTNATNADTYVDSQRRGRKSQRVDLNMATGEAKAADKFSGSAKVGLNTQ